MEDIYEYSKLNKDKNFCRAITIKQLITKDKKTIDHKSLLFFSDFDIKRLINSEHILLDGTFIYPIDYMQTIIFMYYDIITEKMIPGIFLIINNKTFEGYVDSFMDIKNYIKKLNINQENLKFKTYTMDFEVGLYKAFELIFNQEHKIRHIGCYFHFLQNIRKFLQKNYLTTLKNMHIYNVVMNFFKSLPFLNLSENKIIKIMESTFKNFKNELQNFISYFKDNWLFYFKDGSLNLNDVNIKFRTNNSLENFNRQLKNYFNKKKNIPLVSFIDVLKEEVNYHTELIINENLKSFRPLSKAKLKGSNFNCNDTNDNNFYEDISKEILSFDIESINNSEKKDLLDNKPDNINKIDTNKCIKNYSISENAFNESNYNKNFIDNDKLAITLNENKIYDNIKIGFNNLRNTCYLNSSLQIVLHLKIFVNNITSNKKFHVNDLTASLVNIIENIEILISKFNFHISELSFSPKEFLDKFVDKHDIFSNNI